MKYGLIFLLKVLIILFACGVFIGMVKFPQTEGRAANLDPISIYSDPLIIYTYLASIPFFAALYQGYKILGYINENKLTSKASMKSIRNIKYLALLIPTLIMGALVFIVLNAKGDDFAGPVALGVYTSMVSIGIAVIAQLFERNLAKQIRKNNPNIS
jgi:uncharacterized membrane protein YbjE (DUF340 family)